MTKIKLPMDRREWQKIPTKDEVSFITLLSVAEGLILERLEAERSCALSDLVTELDEPSIFTIMAVGSLVSKGLLKSKKSGQRIVLELF